MSKKNTTPDNATQPAESIETLGQLCDAFTTALPSMDKSAGTARSYAADLAVAKRHFGSDMKITKLSKKAVAAYFESDAVLLTRKGAPKSKITSAKIKRVFRMALLWAEGAGLVEEAPLPEAAQP